MSQCLVDPRSNGENTQLVQFVFHSVGIYFLRDHKSCHPEKVWSSSGKVCGFLQMAVAQASIINDVFSSFIKPVVLPSVVCLFAPFLYWIALLDAMYISYFHIAVTTTPIRTASREERFVLAQSL